MNTNYLTIGALITLLFLSAGVVAYEISGEYTDEGQKWLNEHWGENITIGDLARIAYTEDNYKKIQANVDPNLLEKIWNKPYYWGSQHPWGTKKNFESPYGANIWDESGPLNIRKLNLSQKLEMGLENAVTDKSGYRIIGYMDNSITQGEKKPFSRQMMGNLSEFTYDLLWGDIQNSLKLTIFAPDRMIGSYYDDSDGIINGRIYLQVSRPEGIEPGQWYAVVEGEQVDGTLQFMLLVL